MVCAVCVVCAVCAVAARTDSRPRMMSSFWSTSNLRSFTYIKEVEMIPGITYKGTFGDVVKEDEVTEHGDKAEKPKPGHNVDDGVLEVKLACHTAIPLPPSPHLPCPAR